MRLYDPFHLRYRLICIRFSPNAMVQSSSYFLWNIYLLYLGDVHQTKPTLRTHTWLTIISVLSYFHRAKYQRWKVESKLMYLPMYECKYISVIMLYFNNILPLSSLHQNPKIKMRPQILFSFCDRKKND